MRLLRGITLSQVCANEAAIPDEATDAVADVKKPDESEIYRSQYAVDNGHLLEFPFGDERYQSTYDLFKRGLQLSPFDQAFGTINEKNSLDWLTYTDMEEQSSALGKALVDNGLVDPVEKDGQEWMFVGLYAEHRVEWTLTELAVARQGITLVPIYDTGSVSFVDSILRQTGLTTIVTTREKFGRISQNLNKIKNVILLDSDSLPDHPDLNVYSMKNLIGAGRQSQTPREAPVSRDLVNTICFTSGTTGEPKGALITHKMFVAVVAGAHLSGIDIRAQDTHIAYLPPAHVFERLVDLVIMFNGARIGYYSGSILNIGRDIPLIQPTMLVGVPRVFDRTLERIQDRIEGSNFLLRKILGWAANSAAAAEGVSPPNLIVRKIFERIQAVFGGRLRMILSGSSALSPETHRALRQLLQVQVVQGYGMTETTGGTLVTDPESLLTGVTGWPLACVEVKLADVSIHSAVHGEGAGEIYARGPTVFTGYFGRPDLSAQALTDDGWVRTGDVAKVVGPGGFKIVGRAKEIFKLSNGEYVVPGLVESAYRQCPIVEEIFIDVGPSGVTTIAVVNVNKKELAALLSSDVTNFTEEGLNTEGVVAVVRKALSACEGGVSPAERVKGVYVSLTPFGLGTEFQTATAKPIRSKISKFFADKIQTL